MRMLLITFRDSREPEVYDLLKKEGIKAFTDVRDHLAEHQHGAKIPMRLFVLPCEQMI